MPNTSDFRPPRIRSGGSDYAPTRREPTKPKPWVPPEGYKSRKSWRKWAAAEWGTCIWVGGVLYTVNGAQVPGVPHMPKPGKEAGGWNAGHTPAEVRPVRSFESGGMSNWRW